MSTLLTEHPARVAHPQRPSHVRHVWLSLLPPLRGTRRARIEEGGTGSPPIPRRPADGAPAEPTFDLFRDAAWAAGRQDRTQ